MGKVPKCNLEDLPEAGTVFAMPLADGRLGVCRVIKKELKESPGALVAAADWIGHEPPSLDDPALRRILILNHHNWREDPGMAWVSGRPPKDFRLLGRINVNPAETKTGCNSYAAWNFFQVHILAQWRWDHEHEAVMAEDKIQHEASERERKKTSRKRSKHLANVSFSDLLKKDLFPQWNNYPSKPMKSACQKIIQSFVQSLDKTPKPLDQKLVSQELKKCVTRLNEIDSQGKNFIETEEREDLCEILEEVLGAAKFPYLMGKVEDWKNW